MPSTLPYDPSQSGLSFVPDYAVGATNVGRGTRIAVVFRYRPAMTPDDLDWAALADESFAEDWNSSEDSAYDQL